MPDHALDRVAQFILSIVYTSNHVDFGTAYSTDYANIQKARMRDLRIREVLKGVNRIQKSRNDFIAKTIARKTGQSIAPLHFLYPRGEEADVSEIENDTVAVVVQGGTLYFAINYKIRRQGPFKSIKEAKTPSYRLEGFNAISPTSFGLVRQELREELRRKAPRGAPALPGEDLLNMATQASFVELVKAPTTKEEAASAHAEMQLMSYLFFEKGANVSGLYFGVSKACCPKCASALRSKGVGFAAVHGNRVTNWRPYGAFRTRVREARTFELAQSARSKFDD